MKLSDLPTDELTEMSPIQRQHLDALRSIGQKMQDVNNIYTDAKNDNDNALMAAAKQKLAQLAKQKMTLELRADFAEDASAGASCSSGVAAGPAGNLFAETQKRVKENAVSNSYSVSDKKGYVVYTGTKESAQDYIKKNPGKGLKLKNIPKAKVSESMVSENDEDDLRDEKRDAREPGEEKPPFKGKPNYAPAMINGRAPKPKKVDEMGNTAKGQEILAKSKDAAIKRIQPEIRKGNASKAAKHGRFAAAASKKLDKVEETQLRARTKWIIESKSGEFKMVSAPATWTREQVKEASDCNRIVEAPNFLSKAIKNVKRGMSGWPSYGLDDESDKGSPKDVIRRNKEYDTDTLKRMQHGDKLTKHSPGELQQKVISRELKKRSLGEAPMKPVRSYMTGGPDDPAVKAKARSAEKYARSKEGKLAELRTEPIDEYDLGSDTLEKLADQGGVGMGGRVEEFSIRKSGVIDKSGVKVAAIKVTVYVDVDLADMYDQQTIDQMYHGESHTLESFNATIYRDPQNPRQLRMTW